MSTFWHCITAVAMVTSSNPLVVEDTEEVSHRIELSWWVMLFALSWWSSSKLYSNELFFILTDEQVFHKL